MNKPIQAVTFSNPPVKIAKDVSERSNGDTEGAQFSDLLTGEEADSASPVQVHDRESGAAGPEPVASTAPDSGSDEPAATALDTVQQQLAETGPSVAQVAQLPEPVRSLPSAQPGQAPQTEQLPLPGIQTAGQAGPVGTAEVHNAAAVQVAEAVSAVLAEQGANQEHHPPVTAVNVKPQSGTPVPAELAGLQATPAAPVTPATPAIPVPASADAGTRELPLPEPATVTARNGQQAIAAALGSQAGTKQLLPDGRNTTSLKADVIAPGTAVDSGMTEFGASLTEAGVKPASARVPVPVGQPGWGRAVGEQVVWFVSRNINAANLRLNPQHLGPLEMQVSLEGTQANVTFTSQHAVVREALESALPRLREMLADNGLSLANVNVSQHNSPEQRGQGAFGTPQADSGAPAIQGEPDTDPDLPSPAATLLGLVDTYA
mgnify:CR=1 FL=1